MSGMGFAVVFLALVCALLWWRLSIIERTVQAHTPAALLAAVEDLRTAVASINATNRREFGAIWKRMGLSRRPPPAEETIEPAHIDTVDRAANDDAFSAMLAMQSAPPVEPKK